MFTNNISNQASQSKKSLKLAAAFLLASVSFLGVNSTSNIANAAEAKCVKTIKGVSLCVESKGEGYEIYSKIGPVTSQKQYLGKDGGCATFGTVDVAGSRVQTQGCLKIKPVRLEGKAEACFFRKCKSNNFSLNLQ